MLLKLCGYHIYEHFIDLHRQVIELERKIFPEDPKTALRKRKMQDNVPIKTED